MKKIILCLALFLALPMVVLAAKPVEKIKPTIKVEMPPVETIQDFKVQAELGADRLLKVTETINYDFTSTPRHGIYRNIPESYIRNGMTYDLGFDVVRVSRDGQPEQYQQSRQGKILTLKIGKADETISGRHVYTIVYKTNQAVNFFDDGHSELYWNVTGNDWQVDIGQASFFLKSPMGEATSTLRFVCYTGEIGSVEEACDMRPESGGYLVSTERVLYPGEGLTVVFGFPKGVIAPETFWEAAQRILSDNWVLFIPFIILALMIYYWATRGKDPPPETVIPQYETPRGMSPAVLSGALGSGSIPHRGITATIIDMARKDYLHIEYKTEKGLFSESQSYTFIKRNKPVENLNSNVERIVWDGLFDSGTRDKSTFDELKDDKFYLDVQNATKEATKELQKLNIFVASPYAVRAFYIAAAVILFMVVRVLGGDAPIATGAAMASAIIVAVVGWFMPRRTKNGTSIVAEVKGFKWFLSVTEEERLKFHNAPARTPEQFMELLPAAIALGVEKEWAKQFEDLQLPPPEWAKGDAHLFTTLALANAISHLDSTSATIYSPPSSSAGGGGSGFSGGGSGGGFGGGGGGSW
jgi:uncharacterized membrane protein